MRELLPPAAYRYADKARKAYWKVAQPKRFGVKALILHPDDDRQFVLIRQSYGDTTRFALPGGGYRPKRETPQAAVAREVRQELGLGLASDMTVLRETHNTSEYKTDHVTILGATALSTELHPNNEIAEALWFCVDDVSHGGHMQMSRFVYQAIAAYRSPQH